MRSESQKSKAEDRGKSEVRSPKSEVNSPATPQWTRRRKFVATGAGVVALVLAALFFWKADSAPDLAAQRAAQRTKARAELTAFETEMLTTCGWLDQGRGIVHIPVEDAMKLSERLNRDPASARSNLLERLARATAPGARQPSKSGQIE